MRREGGEEFRKNHPNGSLDENGSVVFMVIERKYFLWEGENGN